MGENHPVSVFGFCTVDEFGPAVLSRHGVAPLTALPGLPHGSTPAAVRDMLADWDSWADIVEDADRSGKLASDSVPDTAVSFLPPIVDPPTIYCAGANYSDHAREMGTPLPDKQTRLPFHFLISPAALTGHRRVVRRPKGCQKLDWEVELAVVIGKHARDIAPSEAAAHVAGYTVANDISARDHMNPAASGLGIDWLRHKSFDTSTPTGPAIIPRRYVPDPGKLELQLTVNGQMKQSSRADKMIYSIGEQLAELSSVAPLKPGDLVLTGTPAGTGKAHGHYLWPGDLVVATVNGLGQLENRIV